MCVADNVLPECCAVRAVFYCPKDESVLMMHNPDVDLYFTIGGTVQHQESNIQTLMREIEEEIGYQLAPHTVTTPIWHYEKVVQRKKEGVPYWCLNKNVFYYMKTDEPFTVGTQGFDAQEKKDNCKVQWMQFEALSEISA